MKSIRVNMWRRLRGHFAAGLLVLAPVLLTLWIVVWLFRSIAGILNTPTAWIMGGSLETPLPLLGWTGLTVGHLVPLVSFVALVLIILGTGAFARNFVGSQAVAFGERLLARIPVVRRIYLAVRQISEALFADRRGVFRRAVLFEYPRKGIWSVGFVTAESTGEVDSELPGVAHYHVFLPTTPNPTSGYLLMIPQEECRPLQMSIEDALKLIISGGAVSPDAGPR